MGRFFGKLGAACAALTLTLSSGAAAQEAEQVIAFTGCRIVASPESPALVGGVLVVRDNRIAAIGPAAQVKVPAGAELVDCGGNFLMPAFWNSHVHFMEPDWRPTDQPAERVAAKLQAMLGRYGVAHAVDTGSTLPETLALKRRVDAGEVAGPSIITAGSPFVAPDGTPFYVPDVKFPELRDPDQARLAVRDTVAAGAGAIKLMSVSLTRTQPFPFIPVETIKAVSEEAHRAGVKVLVHPTDRQGVELAAAGGADVIVHTAPIGGEWDAAFAQKLADSGVRLIPTLKLWAYEAAKANDAGMAQHFAKVSQQQLAAFRKAGGRVLFGTDVGYMTDYDPADEYAQMAAAGMSPGDILASLTVEPVEVFGNPRRQGKLAPGYDADIVLLGSDPSSDVRKFADVQRTYRKGRLIYAR